jgi:hypothetical protein
MKLPLPVSVRPFALVGLIALAWAAFPATASAHCDTLDGPVVAAARLALQRGDVAPVLKWVKADAEAELRTAFQKALSVRGAGGAARDLADQFFFETLVRLHRAGEGAPYTGLKPAGTVEKPIAMADEAIVQGSAEGLSKMIAEHMAAGVRERLARVKEAKASAEDSAEAGRRYVAAYVDYVHYVEAVVKAVHGEGAEGHAHAAETMARR